MSQYTPTRTHARTHARTHSYTRARLHTHTHTHLHTYMCVCVLCVVCLCVVCPCVVGRVSGVVCRVSCVMCRVSCVVCRVSWYSYSTLFSAKRPGVAGYITYWLYKIIRKTSQLQYIAILEDNTALYSNTGKIDRYKYHKRSQKKNATLNLLYPFVFLGFEQK